MDELKVCAVKLIDANALKRNIERKYMPSDTISAGMLYDLISTAPEVNRRPAPENKPLTLKQLRQMDGKPVYCVGIKNQGLTGWGLVCTDGHEIIDSYGDFWEFLAYGEEYVAYAHKPEQEEK